MRQRNDRLRRARLAHPSPTAPEQPMSRQELAEAVNAYLHATTGKIFSMNSAHVAKFELGEYHWPREYYREAFRAILGAERDSDLGFAPIRRATDDVMGADLPNGQPPGEGDDGEAVASSLAPVRDSVPVTSMPVQVTIRPGTSVVIGCLGVNPFIPSEEQHTTRLVVEPGISVFVDAR
ncbi:MAG: hypothetical protein JXA67_03090 [Micromonosporaceae bacterium]|nr:hypothetical protein [Micromonosporaceae bacterium]